MAKASRRKRNRLFFLNYFLIFIIQISPNKGLQAADLIVCFLNYYKDYLRDS